MKIIYIFTLSLALLSCSFDTKTGIWKNTNEVTNEKYNSFSDFKTFSLNNTSFDEIIPINKNFNFKKFPIKNNSQWKDIYYQDTNNLNNFYYRNLKKLVFQSKKLSKHNLSKNLLFENNNIIFSDEKGNIKIYSINDEKIIIEFNFYHNRYKKFKKVLNMIIENEIIYVADNLGYLYAFHYKKNKILWAKNYKVPFRSNIKIYKNKIVTSNQNNNLFFFDKSNGEVLKLIPTEETILKNDFVNNLAMKNKLVFFLNTYGSLYAINSDSMKIKWFINLNQSLDRTPANLFESSQIINHKNKIIVSSKEFLYVIDDRNGSITFKKNFSSNIKPIAIGNYLFIITKNSFLISMDLESGKLIYSYDLNLKISDFLGIKKKTANFKNFAIANNYFYIFLNNSFYLQTSIDGELIEIDKLPFKIYNDPIFINGSILFLDKKNKLSVLN